eukprot:7621698-Heterocapsa_arctica.AAC.1
MCFSFLPAKVDVHVLSFLSRHLPPEVLSPAAWPCTPHHQPCAQLTAVRALFRAPPADGVLVRAFCGQQQ